ncbi:gramicidin S biosynthesis grst protein [Rhodovulum sp. P5]|nr:gramicidin S biosynthesis grst protein [Rhodovulum sp. P5]
MIVASPAPALAQESEDGGGFIENFLESKLSGAGREVTVTGFEGALSSRATMEELVIADEDGPWLILRGAVLDWSRAALLRGRIDIKELTADEILLPRLPKSEGDKATVKDSEAKPFSLPDLPVSIEIGKISTEKLELGEALIGQDAVLTIDGAVRLAGGEGGVDLTATRTDAEGNFKLAAGYSNETEILSLYLAMTEGQGGIAASLLTLPGAPSLDLSVIGEGPLSRFGADLRLATDGVQRVAGRVTLAEPEGDPGTNAFTLAVAGDLRPLMEDRFRPFFGERTSVSAKGTRYSDGALDLEDLQVAADALNLTGTLELSPSGLPERFSLDGRLDGPVVLPVPGPAARVDGVDLVARFDEDEGDSWSAQAVLDGFSRDGLSIARADLAGSGTIRPENPASVTADVVFKAEGLDHNDPALAQAMGRGAEGSAAVTWEQGGQATLRNLLLTAGNIRVMADATLNELADGLPVEGQARLSVGDLSRLGSLAGRDLGGSAEARVSGRYGLLDGIFDVTLDAATQDLAAGIPQLDPLLAGRGTVGLSAARGPEGTTLRDLDVQTDAVTLAANASLSASTGGGKVRGEIHDLSLVDPNLSGPATVTADAAWEADGNLRLERFTILGAGAEIDGTGTIKPDDPDLPVDADLSFAVADLSAFSGLAGQTLAGTLKGTASLAGAVNADLEVAADLTGTGVATGIAEADKLIDGQVAASVRGSRKEGVIRVDALQADTPQLTVHADPAGNGGLNVAARLSDLALLVPNFAGPVTLDGQVRPRGANWGLDLDLVAPGGTTATVRGTLAQDASTADLTLSGGLPLGLANAFIAPQSIDGQLRFDLALDGPLDLASLSGRVSASGGRVAIPSASLAIEDLGGTVDLSNSTAQINVAGALGAGRVAVRGPVNLTAPFNGDLTVTLDGAELRDPTLYQTTLDGQVTMSGPLTGGASIGGRIDVGRTEVMVPSSGSGAGGPIPDIVHIGASSAVQGTRVKAGLIKTSSEGGSSGPGYPLDLVISAPSQIFVRGRGLEAELGGRMRLRGTTSDIVPEGQFDLIRGRLDIMTQRFDLDEGRVSLQGALEPYILFVVDTQRGDTDFEIRVEGRARQPEITFNSSPELPEDEVLAQLLFGEKIDSLSAFQAVQLAAAASELAGGGEGFFGNLRRNIGLDQLDVTTGADGGAQVAAGKYISDNLYSEVVVNSEGQTEIHLNLDVTRSLSVTGSVDDQGDTGIGFFFQRDY